MRTFFLDNLSPRSLQLVGMQGFIFITISIFGEATGLVCKNLILSGTDRFAGITQQTFPLQNPHVKTMCFIQLMIYQDSLPVSR